MNLAQYICFKLDTAIEMLMDGGASKTDCALYLMEFKDELMKPEREIITVEATVVDEIKYLGDGHGFN